MDINILFIGDIVGKGGRRTVRKLAPELRREFNCAFCVANGENAASGAGISAKCATELSEACDVITTGDHVWDQKCFENEIKQFKNVLRPANFHAAQPGRGWGIFRVPVCGEIGVINLCGKIFMRESANCPFETAVAILREIPKTVKTVIVDFHTEATSEIAAMAHFLDGKVSAVIGTHTHVQTADGKVLSGGTAFISDVGMVGAEYSVLGRTVESVMQKFTSGMPTRLPVEEKGIRLDAVVITCDSATGKAKKIVPISRMNTEN